MRQAAARSAQQLCTGSAHGTRRDANATHGTVVTVSTGTVARTAGRGRVRCLLQFAQLGVRHARAAQCHEVQTLQSPGLCVRISRQRPCNGGFAAAGDDRCTSSPFGKAEIGLQWYSTDTPTGWRQRLTSSTFGSRPTRPNGTTSLRNGVIALTIAPRPVAKPQCSLSDNYSCASVCRTQPLFRAGGGQVSLRTYLPMATNCRTPHMPPITASSSTMTWPASCTPFATTT